MGRYPIHDEPMTPTERMRRYRKRMRTGEVGKKAGLTVKQAAKSQHVSERMVYYASTIRRHSLIDWAELWSRQYGKVGMAFVADICRHADAELQAEMLDLIKREGPRTAKAVWTAIKAEGAPGDRHTKQSQAIAALWRVAQQRALALAGPDEDVQTLASDLLFEASLGPGSTMFSPVARSVRSPSTPSCV